MVLLPGCACCGPPWCLHPDIGPEDLPDSIEVDVSFSSPVAQATATHTQTRRRYTGSLTTGNRQDWIEETATTVHTVTALQGRQTYSAPVGQISNSAPVLAGITATSYSNGFVSYSANILLRLFSHSKVSTTARTLNNEYDQPTWSGAISSGTPGGARLQLRCENTSTSAALRAFNITNTEGFLPPDNLYFRGGPGSGNIILQDIYIKGYEVLLCNGQTADMFTASKPAGSLFPLTMSVTNAAFVFLENGYYASAYGDTESISTLVTESFQELYVDNPPGTVPQRAYGLTGTITIHGVSFVKGNNVVPLDSLVYNTPGITHPVRSACLSSWLTLT